MAKRTPITTEKFIERAKKVHGEEYGYEPTIYIGNRHKVKIICKVHGIFEQLPGNHLASRGCNECYGIHNIKIKKTTAMFIAEAKIIHGDEYSYDDVEYLGTHKKVKIKCKKHGLFEQEPNNHISAKQGCPKCYGHILYTIDGFIERARQTHGDKYQYLIDNANFKGINHKIRIVCKEHGMFEQNANHHIRGSKCPKCNRVSDTETFIAAAIKIHGDKYTYDKTIYSGSTNDIIIICKSHGEFITKPWLHMKGNNCFKCHCAAKTFSTEEFIDRALLVHKGKYKYDKVNYLLSNKHVEIECVIHGIFLQTPTSHLAGDGCDKCARAANTLTQQEFLDRSISIHGNKYTYENVVYIKTKIKVNITCPKHGGFLTSPQEHLRGGGCPVCRSSISKPETLWLNSLNVPKEQRNQILKLDGRIFKPDAIDFDTKIIHEFYGSYYHGNPRLFHPDKYNSTKHIYHIDSFVNTFEREKVLISHGYKIISIWEDVWKAQQKLLKPGGPQTGRPSKKRGPNPNKPKRSGQIKGYKKILAALTKELGEEQAQTTLSQFIETINLK